MQTEYGSARAHTNRENHQGPRMDLQTETHKLARQHIPPSIPRTHTHTHTHTHIQSDVQFREHTFLTNHWLSSQSVEIRSLSSISSHNLCLLAVTDSSGPCYQVIGHFVKEPYLSL